MSDRAAIALDAMGADRGPGEVVSAAALAVGRLDRLGKVVLVGDEELLRPLLAQHKLPRYPAVEVVNAPDVIGMDEKPLQAIRSKKNASMVRALDLVKSGECQAVVSCGNTGALMAGGTLKLRTLPGIERPGLAAVMPRRTGHFVVIDVGANPSSKPEHLVHNALLGYHYSRVALRVEEPSVGLLTIGTEEGKGNERIQETHRLLKEAAGLPGYRGLIEGFHVFDDEDPIDVIVCDGFTGNILLKTCESLAGMFKSMIREELSRNLLRKLGALLSAGAFKSIRYRTDSDRYGGAPLLGLNGNVLKAHGSSSRDAILAAIRVGTELVAHDMNDHVREDIARLNAALARMRGDGSSSGTPLARVG